MSDVVCTSVIHFTAHQRNIAWPSGLRLLCLDLPLSTQQPPRTISHTVDKMLKIWSMVSVKLRVSSGSGKSVFMVLGKESSERSKAQRSAGARFEDEVRSLWKRHTFLDSKLCRGDLLSLSARSSICVSILLLLLLLEAS